MTMHEQRKQHFAKVRRRQMLILALIVMASPFYVAFCVKLWQLFIGWGCS